jgi:hypothetical protein
MNQDYLKKYLGNWQSKVINPLFSDGKSYQIEAVNQNPDGTFFVKPICVIPDRNPNHAYHLKVISNAPMALETLRDISRICWEANQEHCKEFGEYNKTYLSIISQINKVLEKVQ